MDKISVKMIAIFLWAFACGIPIMLITATLSVRLMQANLNVMEISLFSLSVLPYTLKFAYGPLLEKFSVPILTRYMGHARAWMLLSMIGIIAGIILMAICPFNTRIDLYKLMMASLLVGLFGALNDTAEAEYRIELLNEHELAYGTACYTAGFTLGELASCGGTMLLASYFQWKFAYLAMIIPILIGLLAVCLKSHNVNTEMVRTSSIVGKKNQISLSTFLNPIKHFFKNVRSKFILIIIFLYYAPSYVLLMIINPFYLHQNFSINQIGLIKGLPSLVIILLGSFIGGYFCQKNGTIKILFYSLVGYLVNIIILYLMSSFLNTFPKYSYSLLFISIAWTTLIDSVSVVAFIALIAGECRVPYTASQNAWLTSLMSLSKVIFAATGGWLALHVGYESTFLILGLFILGLGVWMLSLTVTQPLQEAI